MLGQIIFGLADKEVRIKLLEIVSSLTLDQAVAIVHTSEMSKLKAEQILPGGSVQAIRKSSYKKAKSAKVTEAAAAAVKTDGATCGKCGFKIRASGHNCPAKKRKFRNCDIVGHFKSICLNAAKLKVADIYIIQISATKDETVKISITPRGGANAEVRTLPNIGSDWDAIQPFVYHRQFGDVQLDAGVPAETAIGKHIKSLGSFKAAVHWKANDGSSRPVGAIPIQIRGHRNVAEPLMGMFHDELMSQVEQGLVRPVPPGSDLRYDISIFVVLSRYRYFRYSSAYRCVDTKHPSNNKWKERHTVFCIYVSIKSLFHVCVRVLLCAIIVLI